MNMIDGEKFLKITRGPSRRATFLLGEVISVNPLQLRFDGYDQPLSKNFKRIGSYSPVAGDRVLVAVVANSHVVLGKIV